MKSVQRLQDAKWIWCTREPQSDEYGEFYTDFDYYGGTVSLAISADSNYAVYLNGELCTFGQYADYPHDKVYDEVDITAQCKQGKNHLAIIAWYYGLDKILTYYRGNAGLLFDLYCGGVQICHSNERIQSRMSRGYENHRNRTITWQMGLGFAYHADREDNWKLGQLEGFSDSVLVDQVLPLRPRPCEKIYLGEPVEAKLIKTFAPNHMLFDLGVNTVGFLLLETEQEEEGLVTVVYGEHLTGGDVERILDYRDFGLEVTVTKGSYSYMNPFRRLGAKYLSVTSEHPLKIRRIALVPTMYPVNIMPKPQLTPKENEIYDICLRTLLLCMHEHYEDCPWREQALYAMDSRNQMLCGYYAFGETKFVRANLELFSKDDRYDGMLGICAPAKIDMAIPSFSLHYLTACAEYLKYSGDVEFLRQIYPKLESILNVFLSQIKPDSQLIQPFKESCYWNFYEWTTVTLRGGKSASREIPDIVLNTLVSTSLQNMATIADAIGVPNEYRAMAEKINGVIHTTFFDEKRGCYTDSAMETKSYSQLGNSLAILCGACTGELAEAVCERMLTDEGIVRTSLSMRCFLYDALLKVDTKHYGDWILADIEHVYQPMLDEGVGTVWETETAITEFGESLCHGWSAIPIYYYHILKGN